jgi:LDH2 family malate/lactate/ureidoglycolate dehydrogenase
MSTSPEHPHLTRVSPETLAAFALSILRRAGLGDEDAGTVADNLVYSDLRGLDSHGVTRLPIYARRLSEGALNTRARPKVVLGADSALRVMDGENGAGSVVAAAAMREAIAGARELHACIVLARNSSHFGAAAYYTHLAAEQGCIGICASNAPATMAAWGARESSLGTNPISFAAPAGRYGELNLDMSSSVVAKGKVLTHLRKGLPIPIDWALAPDGRPTTDAIEAAAGVVLPFAGAKGSGLSLFIDLLSGVLSGAAFGMGIGDQYAEPLGPQNVGQFFIAIDIASIMPMRDFITRVEAFCEEIKAHAKAEGVSEILLPGESKARHFRERSERGIEIDSTLRKELDALARRFGQTPLFETAV